MDDNKSKSILCKAVIRQNYCDLDRQHKILVIDHEMLAWLAGELRTEEKEVWGVIGKWEEEGILQLHPRCPDFYFPEFAGEPDVYIIDPAFYDENIKPHLTKPPETYCI